MTQNLQLVEQPPKPERCAAEDLKPGQFLAAGALATGRPTEVLFVDTFRAHDGGRETLIVHRPVGIACSISIAVGGNQWFDLAAEADLATFRAGIERAQKLDDLQQAVDFLSARPWLPLPDVHVHVHLHDLDGYRQVQELAEREGVELDTHLDDRTELDLRVGALYYSAIAWHRDGRPAEPEPELTVERGVDGHVEVSGWKGPGDAKGTCGVECSCGTTYDGFDSLAEARECLDRHIADPDGLSYSRADDPTPVSPARAEPHTGEVLSGIAEDGHKLGDPGKPVEVDFDEVVPFEPVERTVATAWCGCPTDPTSSPEAPVVVHRQDCPELQS